MSALKGLLNRFDRGATTIALAMLLLIFALFMPTIELPRKTYDYIVVFDISQSMYVEDYEIDGSPVSRLIYARNAARRALRTLPCGSRVGWGAFTGYRTMLLLAPVEVCANYSDLLASLEKIDGRMRWSEASEISKGVYWAVRAAQETQPAPHVIFLTDGQEAPPIDPGYPSPLLAELKGSPIRGWLIGTGGYAANPIPKFDADGKRQGYWRSYEVIQAASTEDGSGDKLMREHLSGLRETYLQALAKRVGFGYARLVDEASLSATMNDPKLARSRAVATDVYGLPVGLALLLLALRFWPYSR
jgi:mxaL protein